MWLQDSAEHPDPSYLLCRSHITQYCCGYCILGYLWRYTHIYTPEIPDHAPSWSLHGAQLGGSLGFPRNQNNCISSSACYLHVLQYEHEDKHASKRCAVRKDHECICFAFACAYEVHENLKIPKLSPMADNTITQGGIGSLVCLVYICGYTAATQTGAKSQCFTYREYPNSNSNLP